jgi:hypothetical protein
MEGKAAELSAQTTQFEQKRQKFQEQMKKLLSVD